MSLTSEQARDRERLNVAYLFEIQLRNSGPLLHFSERNITVGGVDYEDYITEFEGLEEELRRNSQYLNYDINIKFKNDRFQAYNHLSTIGDTYPFELADLTIKRVYLDDDGTQSTVETIVTGILDEPQEMDLLNFECSVSSVIMVKDSQWKQEVIDETDFPDADPDDIGKVRNIIIGSVEQVRCHAIKAGAVDILAEDITTDSQTVFDVSNASGRKMPSGTITLQCENEEMRGSFSGNTFTVTTRGYNNTDAVPHDKGMKVFVVLTEYIYLVADHPVKAIGDVYIDDMRDEDGIFTGYTGQPGDAHTDWPGKAVLSASVKPLLIKQVNLDLTDGITITNPSHGHYLSGQSQNQNAGSIPAVRAPQSGCNSYGGTEADDITFSSLATTYQGNSVTVAFTRSQDGCYLGRNVHCKINGVYIFKRVDGVTSIDRSSPISFEGAYSGADKDTFEVWVDTSGNLLSQGCAMKVTIDSAERDVIYGSDISTETQLTDRAGAVTLLGNSSADVVIGASVNCDVDGYQDDGSGTYTGTPNALIERPDHVLKFFIVALWGFASGTIDATSFSAAGTLYAAAISGGYEFGFLINKEIIPSELLYNNQNSLAIQCRSTLKYRAGNWYLNYIPDSAPAAVATIPKEDLAGEFAKFKFGSTSSLDIENDFLAYYKKNYGRLHYEQAEYLCNASDSDSASQTKYEAVLPGVYYFDAIRLPAMAVQVLAFIKLQKKNKLKTAEFTVFWEYSGLKEGDTIDISNPLNDGMKLFIEQIREKGKSKLIMEGIEWPA